MNILVVSQRAVPNPNFSLNDLSGHGRIDVLIRCILAGFRRINQSVQDIETIFCYMKGDSGSEGWLEWNKELDQYDEISLAGKIKENWRNIFHHGTQRDLLEKINPNQIILLSEEGISISELDLTVSNPLFVLGAQLDLSNEDLSFIKPQQRLMLTSQPMLASHAIIMLRQKLNLSIQPRS